MYRIFVLLHVYLAQCVVHPFYPGLQMGIGADSNINSYYATALKDTNFSLTNFVDGQETEWSFKMVSRSEEIFSELNLDSSTLFKIRDISISNIAAFVQKCNLNQYSTQFLVQYYIKNSVAQISRPSLSEEAKDYLNENGLVKFQQLFGPEYLSGIVRGGIFLGLISVDTQSKSENQEVATGVKFFESSDDNFDIKISDTAQDVFNKRRVETYSVQIGGHATNATTSIRAMIDRLQAFPEQVLQHPVPIQGIFNNYHTTIVYNWSEQGIDHTIRNDLLQKLSNRLSYLKDRNNDLQYVHEHYDQFDELENKSQSNKIMDMKQISREVKEIVKEMNIINNYASACIKNIGQCVEPSLTYSPEFQLPQLDNDVDSEPHGIMTMYFGNIKKIPFGWQLCNGSSGTPDMRGRFPLEHPLFAPQASDRVGFLENQVTGNIGGSSYKVLSIGEMPKHTHQVQYNGEHFHSFGSHHWYRKCGYNWMSYSCLQTSPITRQTSIAGNHSHQLTQTGGSKAFEIVPPYVIVHYICKIK